MQQITTTNEPSKKNNLDGLNNAEWFAFKKADVKTYELLKALHERGIKDVEDFELFREALLSENEVEPEGAVKSESEPQKENADLLPSLFRWNDIINLTVSTTYLLAGLIPQNSIILLFGRGGIGKTSLSLQIARAIAEGLPFGELQTLKTPVYYIDFENPLSVLKERVEKIGLSDNLWVWHISNTPMPPRLDDKNWELYKKLPPGLLVFDTLRAGHLSDENNSKDMAVIIARLKELREAGFTILLLHHTPKGNENIYKGSTAILDLVDHVLSLEDIRDENTVEFDKENIYRFGTRIKTRYEPFHFFLKFNSEIKGFEIAKDPDYEQIDSIYEILKDFTEPPKQKELKDRIKSELGLTEGEARKLLRKGEGIAWDARKGGDKNRSLIYIFKPNGIMGYTHIGHPINTLEFQEQKSLSNYNKGDSDKTLDNAELDNRGEYIYPINILKDINLKEGEI